MSILNENIMNLLGSLQNKQLKPAYAMDDAIFAAEGAYGCSTSCAGTCDHDCSGSCDYSCAGSCNDSCDGSCQYGFE